MAMPAMAPGERPDPDEPDSGAVELVAAVGVDVVDVVVSVVVDVVEAVVVVETELVVLLLELEELVSVALWSETSAVDRISHRTKVSVKL